MNKTNNTLLSALLLVLLSPFIACGACTVATCGTAAVQSATGSRPSKRDIARDAADAAIEKSLRERKEKNR